VRLWFDSMFDHFERISFFGWFFFILEVFVFLCFCDFAGELASKDFAEREKEMSFE